MRLIGAGWGRTGTTSLVTALERLGVGPCLQMQRMWAAPELAEVWNRARTGHPVDWPAVLAGWQATVDWPGCWEWGSFAKLWPDAPVLLTLRDPEEWYDSVRLSIHAWTAPGKLTGPPAVVELFGRIWTEDFDGWHTVLDRRRTIAAFQAHNEEVRDRCPRDRLHVWNIGDGWAPLCRVLDVPVPDEPFPHLNR